MIILILQNYDAKFHKKVFLKLISKIQLLFELQTECIKLLIKLSSFYKKYGKSNQ